jgi:hypothetical protein
MDRLNTAFIYHWHSEVALCLFLVTAYWAWQSELERNQLIILFNFWVFLLHQFEEYRWPGWFPMMMNMSANGVSDRYPFNRNNSAWGNQLFRLYYFIPALFPDKLFLSAGVILINVMQIFGHGVYMNIKIKRFYNPGVFTALVGHLPLSLVFVKDNAESLTLLSFGEGFLYLMGFMVTLVIIEMNLLADVNSKYPFSKDEMNRFNHVMSKRVSHDE